MKALVIDSSPINRERIVSLLMGVNNIGIISQAEDKETAERMIEELQSEFVVLNTYIHQEWGPRTNSIALLKKIKRRNPSTIVVMSEDLPHTPDQNDYLTLGAEFFIDPSHNLDRWAKTIEGLLQG
jgi:DNA-binding NarL/FixJ family response regulator